MGHRHSKSKKPSFQPEVTEIIELNDNPDEEDVQDTTSTQLQKLMESVELLEKSIDVMTSSQLDLYYATIKDDLHNTWQKVYELPDSNDTEKSQKIQSIERVKQVLKGLNNKVLMNGR